MKPLKFIPPVSIAAAEARRLVLVAQSQEIDAQLTANQGDKKWRASALAAKAYVVRELRVTNAWLKTQRVFAHAVSSGGATHPNHTFAMLARAYRVLRKLACEVDLEPDEQKTIDDIHDFITHQMPPVAVGAEALDQ